MLRLASTSIRSLASSFQNQVYWYNRIKDEFGLDCTLDKGCQDGHILLRLLYLYLFRAPKSLIRDCGLRRVLLKFLGPNKPFYPNHGYYIGDLITLNTDMFWHPDYPDDFIDQNGYRIGRVAETLWHEIGHAHDAYHGDLSLKPDWLKLSGWSETFQPGLKRLIIKEQGSPEVVGEWFYDPKSKFTRFYAQRNPYDDWADCFGYYVAGLKSAIPSEKRAYFDILLKKYFS